MNKTITGHKGGSKKPRQPVEMPDSVRSIARAKILLALGEGEFDGGVDGRSIYLDDTPLLAADGSVNFPGVTWSSVRARWTRNTLPVCPPWKTNWRSASNSRVTRPGSAR